MSFMLRKFSIWRLELRCASKFLACFGTEERQLQSGQHTRCLLSLGCLYAQDSMATKKKNNTVTNYSYSRWQGVQRAQSKEKWFLKSCRGAMWLPWGRGAHSRPSGPAVWRLFKPAWVHTAKHTGFLGGRKAQWASGSYYFFDLHRCL